MSRLGKKPIMIPEKTEVKTAGTSVTVRGPLGTLSREFPRKIAVTIEPGKVTLSPKENSMENRTLWGTTFAHLSNMIQGVNKGFEKRLIVEGIGFKADVKGNDLVLSLGFSHPVKVPIPKDLKVVSDKAGVSISGIDIESVGQFAAFVRSQKKPEPYKGKGIHYSDEVVKRKQGKKTV